MIRDHVGVHARCAGGDTDRSRVVVCRGHEERVHTVCRWMIHRSRLAHGSWRVGTTSGERSGEGGWNFRCENGGGRREDELLCDNTEKGLGEACEPTLVSPKSPCYTTRCSPRTLLPLPTMMSESQSSLRFVASGTARMVWWI